MAEQRYVVYRPDPTEGWRVQLENFTGEGWVVDDDEPAQNFPEDGKFAEAHEWALAQHPGMEVFVPMGKYVQGMHPEQDVAAQEKAGHAVEEVSA
jgi:hypothetical protein